MHDRLPTATGFVIAIHAELPADWPSARNPGNALCHIFQTREFIDAWMLSYGALPLTSAYFVTVSDRSGMPLMLIPLAIEKKGVRVLSFLDQGHADYNAPILFPSTVEWSEPMVAHLWAQIVSALPPFDFVRLEKMPERVGGLANPLFLLMDSPNPEACHGNDLRRSWPEIEATQSNLKTLKRRRRALEKMAPVRFIIAETDQERARLVRAVAIQKQRRFEETRVPGFEENPAALDFLHSASELFAGSGNLFLCALLVGDEITAVTWGLSWGKTVYALVMGFAGGEWTKYSCGKLLGLDLLKWMHERGYEFLDYGVGEEAWKVENCETTIALGQTVAAHSLLGQAYLTRAGLLARLRAMPLWERLRPLKWIAIRAMRRRLGAVGPIPIPVDVGSAPVAPVPALPGYASTAAPQATA